MKLALVILLLSFRPAVADRAPVKGWELYSWFDLKCSARPHFASAPNADSVCFALLPGTNRTKTTEEIQKLGTGIAALEQRIAKLGAGQDVVWLAPGAPFDLPDARRGSSDPRNRAVAALARRGAKLVIVKP